MARRTTLSIRWLVALVVVAPFVLTSAALVMLSILTSRRVAEDLASSIVDGATRQGIASGQVLVIGTDGIWEMADAAGKQFGKERLRQVIRESHDRPVAEIATALEEALAGFRGQVRPQDDVTFVIIKIL